MSSVMASVAVTRQVHNFTLLDVNARGYVRPMAMSYICFDQRKLTQNLQLLVAEFGRISALFKRGNFEQFLEDVVVRIDDLQSAHDSMLSDPNPDPDAPTVRTHTRTRCAAVLSGLFRRAQSQK
jgi:hypothetical protein